MKRLCLIHKYAQYNRGRFIFYKCLRCGHIKRKETTRRVWKFVGL